jgi:hypothetical protein
MIRHRQSTQLEEIKPGLALVAQLKVAEVERQETLS